MFLRVSNLILIISPTPMTKSHHIPERLIILNVSKDRTGCLHLSLNETALEAH